MQQDTQYARAPRNTLKSLWRAVFWVSFPFGILSFVLPLYGYGTLKASALEIGGFFSAFSLVPVVVRPFLGRMLDRWGRKPFLLLGLLGYVAAVILFCLSSTVSMVTTARFVQGLGAAFLWLSAHTIVADAAHESERGHGFGIINEASSRGAIIGTAIGFAAIFILDDFGLDLERIWFWLFAAYAAPALLALWNGWRGVEETRPLAAIEPVESQPISGQLLALMAIVFFTGASANMVWPLLMIFLQDALGAGAGDLALAYLPAALIQSFLPSRMGGIADRLGRKRPMIGGLVVGSAASALIPHLGSLIALTVLWAVESLGYTASVPAERAFVADIAGGDIRGASYGLYTFAYYLGAAAGPLVGGWLYDNVGHPAPFYLNTFVLVIGALLVAIILREPHLKSETLESEAI